MAMVGLAISILWLAIGIIRYYGANATSQTA